MFFLKNIYYLNDMHFKSIFRMNNNIVMFDHSRQEVALGSNVIMCHLLSTDDPRHKVYSSSIKRLQHLIERKSLKIYQKQRCLNEERVNKLAAWQTQHILNTGFPKVRGNIVICRVTEPLLHFGQKQTQMAYIIDGQHRYESLCQVVNSTLVNDIKVLIEWIEVSSNEEMDKEFQEINSGVPVPQHYVNPNEIVNRCVEILSTRYTQAFAKSGTISSSIKRPQMSVDTFKDALIKDYAQIVKNYKIASPEQLVDLLENLNVKYQKKGVDSMCDDIARQNQAQRSIVKKAFAKCEVAPPKYMFLGLFKENNWITDLNVK